MRSLGVGKICICYLLAAVVAGLGMGHTFWTTDALALGDTSSSLTRSLLIGAAVGLAIVYLSRVLEENFAWAQYLAQELKSIVGPLNNKEIVMLALSSSLAEELIFRGLLQPAVGLWLSSAIFGLVHIGPHARFLSWALMAAGAGLAFGLILEFTGSLLGPILAHFLINFINLRHLVFEQEPAQIRWAEC
jgi:uncharacterized protein